MAHLNRPIEVAMGILKFVGAAVAGYALLFAVLWLGRQARVLSEPAFELPVAVVGIGCLCVVALACLCWQPKRED